MSALVWWLIPIFACTGALLYVWWSITSKRRQNTYKSISEYENFRSAFTDSPTSSDISNAAVKTRAMSEDEPLDDAAQDLEPKKSKSSKKEAKN